MIKNVLTVHLDVKYAQIQRFVPNVQKSTIQ
jgi:hypothetical protein